jgi:hypothetical protein
MQKMINVFRIDYEIRDKEDGEMKLWTACIAAYDQKEALDYLGAFLGRTFKIIQLERRSDLHALSDQVRQKVIDGYLSGLPRNEVKTEKDTEKEPKSRGRSITKK